MTEPHYELQPWEREFRDMHLKDLPMIKFILDDDTLTYAVRNLNCISFRAWGECLQRFLKESFNQMTTPELLRFDREMDELNRRTAKFNEDMKRYLESKKDE